MTSLYSLTIHNEDHQEFVNRIRGFSQDAFLAIHETGGSADWYGWTDLEPDMKLFSKSWPELEFSIDEQSQDGEFKRYNFHAGEYTILRGSIVYEDKSKKLENYLRNLLEDENQLIDAQEDFIGFIQNVLNRL